MKGLAREINFSETTFLLPPTSKECNEKVRIFSTSEELLFAGHPVIGSSFVLKDKGIIPSDSKTTKLELGIGPVTVEYGDNQNITMQQPKPSFLEEFQDKQKFEGALGITPGSLFEEYPLQFVSTGNTFLMVPVKTLKSVQQLRINQYKIDELLTNYPSKHLYIFTLETMQGANNIHARMIQPTNRMFEDPATGSAAGPLIAYLEKYSVLKDHEKGSMINIEQGYEISRPSLVTGQIILKNESIEGVKVGGKVKLTMDGTYYI